MGSDWNMPRRVCKNQIFKNLKQFLFPNAYGLVSTNSGVVWDVSNDILTPDERMVIIGLELLGHELCPGFNRLELLLAVDVRKVSLNRKHRRGSNAAADDTE